MTEVDELKTELAHTRLLLSLAESVILQQRSGRGVPQKEADGGWGRENDRAGLREVLSAAMGDVRKEGLGKFVWYGVSGAIARSRSFSPASSCFRSVLLRRT
jgi:hypothetical protein